MAAEMRVSATFSIAGYRARELDLRVPLGPSSQKTIVVHATELTGCREPTVPTKPYLVFLQGGPGFPAPRAVDGAVPAWVGRAIKDYRVLLIDQRGTGRSTAVTSQALAHLSTDELVDYLAAFRADNIVEDLEAFRKELSPDQPWSLLGQSYGGFIITRYITVKPSALKEVFFTGGLPITGSVGEAPSKDACPADDVYRALCKRVLRRNDTYYGRYPADVAAVQEIVAYLRANDVRMPRGGRLTARRFRALGIKFGFTGGFDELHCLVRAAFVDLPCGRVLTDAFLNTVETYEAWETNPIYAILHESIYCDGGAPSSWSAHRIVAEFPEFGDDFDGPFNFTGEMVFPWMFEDCEKLRGWKAAAEALAQRSWPRLYEGAAPPAVAPGADAPVGYPKAAAIVYHDDMYVERTFSEATAQARIPGIKLWITNVFDHGGLRADGATVLDRLIKLAYGELLPR